MKTEYICPLTNSMRYLFLIVIFIASLCNYSYGNSSLYGYKDAYNKGGASCKYNNINHSTPSTLFENCFEAESETEDDVNDNETNALLYTEQNHLHKKHIGDANSKHKYNPFIEATLVYTTPIYLRHCSFLI